MRTVCLAIFLGLAFSAGAVDYTNHDAICQSIADNRTHAWAIGEKEQFRIKCPCELEKFEKALEPVKYRALVDWKIDAKAFARNAPAEIGSPLNFLMEITPLSIKIDQAC